ncbi:MAG: large-conductance mechanosensitive channel protein MscL [Duncaniella sp.]|nr:large-conductance mechanosensitive channel protein MscL [Duncaniella sp.]MDE6061967.1 large-conductance mechanosensitive channel protein MscL [Duncaniella sp.]MDE6812211.1 large-conductance mechanosensitive channel protein MscL [Duncaniella sp.]MDE6824961.1 large-conductance mechanosensitive channel protein MscL [Duncaniella sp.]MDE7474875.1 large-conductance mechanosensitive channel protein MscL [Duncaniella sp.]
MIKEFKEFAMRGNVIDMAVGVVIGAAFGKIISSLVDDIIMPLVGVATGGMNFTDYKFVIQKAVIDGTTQEILKPEVTLNWGTWIQTIVDFLIVAFCIFIAIKAINQMKRKNTEPEPAPAPAEPTKEEVLLTEIRDLLKNQQK